MSVKTEPFRKFPDENTTRWELEEALKKFKRGDVVIFARPEKENAEKGIFSRYEGRDKDGNLLVSVGDSDGFYWHVPFTCVAFSSK